MKSCRTCRNRVEIDGGVSFCTRFPPSIKANGKSSYPQVEETTLACGEFIEIKTKEDNDEKI